MRLICLVMHFVVSKILKYAPQTFLRFDSNVPPQIQNSLLFMVHIHMIYTGFTHFCREISLVAITRFGRHFLAKIGGRRHKNIFEDRAFCLMHRGLNALTQKCHKLTYMGYASSNLPFRCFDIQICQHFKCFSRGQLDWRLGGMISRVETRTYNSSRR